MKSIHTIKFFAFIAIIMLILAINQNLYGINKALNKENISKHLNNLNVKPKVNPDGLNKFSSNLSNNYSQYISNKTSKSQWNTTLNSKKIQLDKFEIKNTNPLGLNIYRSQSGTPTFISGKFNIKNNEDVLLRNQLENIALDYISDNKDLFLIDAPYDEFKLSEKIYDEESNKHLRFSQYFSNIPIWGKEIILHLDKQNQIYLINGRYIPTPKNIDPNVFLIENDKAVLIAENNLKQCIGNYYLNDEEKKLLNWSGPLPNKYIWVDDSKGESHIVWHIQIRPNIIDNWNYFIDAVDGRILEKYNAAQSDGPTTGNGVDLSGQTRTLNVYLQNGTYYMVDASRDMFKGFVEDFFKRGVLQTEDARNKDLTNNLQTVVVSSANNNWSDPVAVSGHYHISEGYQYYKNTHGRNSLDDNGMSILILIHVTNNNQTFDNAFWNGMFMVFGDGGQSCKQWTGAKDFVGHEMTHAVIQYTVDLEYKFQSGALNEALADWGGAMIDREDWKMGEDIARTSFFPSGAVRDMENPHNGGNNPNQPYWQPAHMNEFMALNLDYDNGGVHINSGIINKATSLIGNSIGKDKLEKIYYRLLKNRYLAKQSQFIDMRLAAVKAASEIYGGQSTEVAAVKSAFDAVGIFDGNETKPDPDKPPVQGNNWLAFVNAELISNETWDNSLFISKPVINNPQTDIKQVTQTQVNVESGCVITIPDNGAFILFIDQNNFVKGIYPDGSGETFISQTGEWHSISISADGKKLAATSKYFEPYIYLFDLENQTSSTIELYVPTTSQEDYQIKPVFADALDWSLDSKVIVYDAVNARINESGDTSYYWDINLLEPEFEVIARLLPPLPLGINAGNPVFSQNNDNFLGFDIFDDNEKKHYINVANLFNGNIGNIVYFDNERFYSGFPSFSVDDKKLSFQYYLQDDGSYNILEIGLNTDKISPSGNVKTFINNAAYPKWFATGSRPSDANDNDYNNTGIISRIYPNPFDDNSVLGFILPESGNISIRILDYIGNQLLILKNNEYVPKGMNSYILNKHNLKLQAGYYFCLIELNASNGKIYKNIIPIINVE